MILKKIDLYFEFVFENAKKEKFNYFSNMIVGVNLILECKNIFNIKELIASKINEQYNLYYKKYYDEIHESNFVGFLSNFVADIFPLEGWSDYPNLWENKIKNINIYMHFFDFIKNDKSIEEELKCEILLFDNFCKNNI